MPLLDMTTDFLPPPSSEIAEISEDVQNCGFVFKVNIDFVLHFLITSFRSVMTNNMVICLMFEYTKVPFKPNNISSLTTPIKELLPLMVLNFIGPSVTFLNLQKK